MPLTNEADLEITAFEWVPSFARGQVRDLRPRWACEEYELAYKARLISAVERPEWYYSDQPWGQVPFLRDGKVRIFESGAILIHLAHKAGALPTPGSQAFATILGWVFAAFNSIEPGIMELANVFHFSAASEWAKARRPSLLESIAQRLTRLEPTLTDEWLTPQFSIADIAMVTVLRPLLTVDEGRSLLADLPRISAYLDRAMARPAFKQALADQLEPFDRHHPVT